MFHEPLIPRRVPDFVVHYARGEPFRSITSLPTEQWPELIPQLNKTNTWGLSRFFDPLYLARRREVERRLRDDFISKGGLPELAHPIYFFLGRHQGFEKHERNQGYSIRLSDIPTGVISFTYGDSLLGYHDEYREKVGEAYRNPLCGKLYRVDELGAVVSGPHYPVDEPLAIEAQLWIMPAGESVTRLVRDE